VEITVPEVSALATEWAADLDRIAGEMYEYLAAGIPEATADDEIAAMTRASCVSNVEAVLAMIRHGIPAEATEAPVTALEHARRMAARGASVDATLRFYRLGHAYFWEVWSAALVEAVPDRERLIIAMRETAAFVFHYIDVVSGQVGAEHLAERERRQRRAAIVRADVVRALLAGERLDRGQAERSLGHVLSGPQLAFVLWTDGDVAGLERAALAIAAAAGVARPLLVPEGAGVLAGWLGAAASTAGDDPLAAAARTAAPEVHVAFGQPGQGLAGFRRSRETAERARRVAELGGAAAPTCTHYADVALVDLLSADADAARAFVATELGDLTDPDLRDTVLAVVRPGGGLAGAARELGVHRNTVLQRVHRAEDLRGRRITERAAELHAALLLATILD
jgi:DNA-binding PucR family transcriptional regulator